ncbi:MAG: hypothetical protein ABGX83_06630 [Nitrospira sp.]|nr:hypothetical protein [Candidatus Manganitrophaceae bacterium]HIL34328.1 hypothetical protein [Candidatus Manganitrophaceae bacterium]
MNEQWIEKKTQRVNISLADGSGIEGEVFLLSETIADILNGEHTFIPVKTSTGVLLLNRSQIVSVTIQAPGEQDELITLGNQYTIQLTMVNGKEMKGDIYANLPNNSSRVKDFLDQPLSFLPLYQPGLVVYFNKKFILSVHD